MEGITKEYGPLKTKKCSQVEESIQSRGGFSYLQLK